MWENTSEKLSVSLGLIPKQYADGGNRFRSTGEVKDCPRAGKPRVTSARQAVTCRGFYNCNFSDVTQSQSNVQKSVISHSFFANKVSN